MTLQIFRSFFSFKLAEILAMKRARIYSRGVSKAAKREFEVVTEVSGLGLEDWIEVKIA